MAGGLVKRLAQAKGANWNVRSAGVAHHPEGAIAENAVTVMKEIGIDISDEYSKPLTQGMMEWADMVITMQEGQADHLREEFPNVLAKVRHLRLDVFDPYCGNLEEYRKCRDLLAELLSEFVAALL